MNRVRTISRAPRAASSPLCTNPTSDFQVKTCFLLTTLTDFFLPILQIKAGLTNNNGNDDGGDTV